jgi:hypothetical protein
MNCGIYGTGTALKMKVSTSEVVKAKSGRFVCADGSGYLQMMSATSVDVMGWVVGSFEATSSSTAGDTEWTIETDFLSKLFVMPACGTAGAATTETVMQGMIGETSDVQMVSTNYQYASVVASAVDILLWYGYIYEGSAAGQQYAIVKVNPVKLAYTSH